MTMRLLIPIIVLQNHNRYNILEKGHNYSINFEAIEAEVKFMLNVSLISPLADSEIVGIFNPVTLMHFGTYCSVSYSSSVGQQCFKI